MKKYLYLPMTLLFFGATSISHAGGFTPVPSPLESAPAPAVSFTKIDSAGNFNITIKPITRYSRNSFVITSPLGNDASVSAVVTNGTLFLRQSPQFPDPITVTVYMSTLQELSAFGGTTVFGNRVRGNSLKIHANTTGTITLTGSIMLREADIAGSTQLNALWVYGNAVDLYEYDNAYVNLSGNIATARIKMNGHSFLDARYLRTHHTWIKTNDYAQAKIIGSNSVQSYPANYSNVYYYKTPVVVNRINTESGNTLQLGWSR